LGFAHRGLHSGPRVPENSNRAFAAALELGCGIECDLRLTADGEVLVFHDPDARRMCASPLVIGCSTASELAQLRVGEQRIPTLASLLKLVDGRVPLLLEVKVDGEPSRWIPVLQQALAAYRGLFGIMSFDPRLVSLLKSDLPQVRRGLVIAAELPPSCRASFLALACPQFLAVEHAIACDQWIAEAGSNLPAYGWTVQTPEQRQGLADCVDALIWEGDGRP
jgi:glycerophosphoryl diester phosphodiesterase